MKRSKKDKRLEDWEEKVLHGEKFKKTKEEQRKNEWTAKRMHRKLLEIWRTRIRTTYGDGLEKII